MLTLEEKVERRSRKYPPDKVRQRKSYKWFEHMLERIKRNTPEDNLRLLHYELSMSGGYYTKKGALMQYKQESMELVIEDNKEKEKQKCNTSDQIGTLDTPTS